MRPWSYSRLSCYESCPLQYKFKYVEALKGSRPSSPAAARGTDIHAKAEEYLLGKLMMYPPELQKVAGHAMQMKAKGAIPEKKLAVTETWEPCDWGAKEVYLRAILDIVITEDTKVEVQDWKTGQVYDGHKDQLDTYVAIIAAHYPDATEFRSRLVYVDQGVITAPKITQANRVKPLRLLLDGRIKTAEQDTIFPSRAGNACRWCDYGAKHGGPCRYG